MRQFILAIIGLIMPMAISAQTACDKVCCANSQNVKTAKAGTCPMTGKSCTMNGKECKADCKKNCKDCKDCTKDCDSCPKSKKDCPKNSNNCKNSCVKK